MTGMDVQDNHEIRKKQDFYCEVGGIENTAKKQVKAQTGESQSGRVRSFKRRDLQWLSAMPSEDFWVSAQWHRGCD